MTFYNPSIVEYFSAQQRRCGYCSSVDGSHSYGLHAHSLKVEDYQNMIDRGWRRCGQYCYKPILEKSCCPLYVIRCDEGLINRCAATNFKLSKTQKKILKRFNNFLVNGTITKEKIYKNTEITMDSYYFNEESQKIHNSEVTPVCVDSPITIKSDLVNYTPAPLKDEVNKPAGVVESSPSSNVKEQPSKDKGMKAKQLRIERKKQKLQKLGLSEEDILKKMVEKKKYPLVKTIEDFMKETQSKNRVHNLKISLVRSSPKSEEFINTFEVVFDLYKHYQRHVHKDPPEKLTRKQFERFLVISPLQIKMVLVQSPDFKKTFKESASLFEKYQKAIHHESDEDCGIDTFHDFLVKSPLEAEKDYGSYHAQYWLDDKLIAVGVIDILPKCVSSVYFFYDPDYAHLSLGTYGALREIELTRQLSLKYPNLTYYYMGFYIHSCVRMKYKGAFKPSYLLCPEAYTWHLIQECLPKIKISKYSRFNEDPDARDANSDVSTSEVLILHNSKVLPLNYHLQKYGCSQLELKGIMEYAKLMGKTCVQNVLLFRP